MKPVIPDEAGRFLMTISRRLFSASGLRHFERSEGMDRMRLGKGFGVIEHLEHRRFRWSLWVAGRAACCSIPMRGVSVFMSPVWCRSSVHIAYIAHERHWREIVHRRRIRSEKNRGGGDDGDAKTVDRRFCPAKLRPDNSYIKKPGKDFHIWMFADVPSSGDVHCTPVDIFYGQLHLK